MNKDESRELLKRVNDMGGDPGLKAQVIQRIMNGAGRSEINSMIDKAALSTTNSQTVTNTRPENGPITSFSQISDEGFVRTILQPTPF